MRVGDRFSLSLQRCRRTHPERLKRRSPSLGQLPARLISNLGENQINRDEPLHVVTVCRPDEAVWFGFADTTSRPVALKIRAGPLDAVSGAVWDETLHESPMNYLVPPDQTSWHGTRMPDGLQQFGSEPVELLVYEPARPVLSEGRRFSWDTVPFDGEESGRNDEPVDSFRIVPDRYGVNTWSVRSNGRVLIAFLDPGRWRLLTGENPPEPGDEYQGHRLP